LVSVQTRLSTPDRVPEAPARVGVPRLAWLGALVAAGLIVGLIQGIRGGHLPRPSLTGPDTPFADAVVEAFTLGMGGRLAAAAVQLVALGLLAWLLSQAVARALPTRWRRFAGPVLLLALPAIEPVRASLAYQTPEVWLVVLLLLEFRLRSSSGSRRGRGVLLGIAAAFQPWLWLFAGLFGDVGRRGRALLAAVSTFALLTLTGWLIRPSESAAYWRHGGLPGGQQTCETSGNQSFCGLTSRLGLNGSALAAVSVALAVPLVVPALRRSRRYLADGQDLLAIGILGCAVALIEPLTGADGLIWLGFAAFGRLGRRLQDRDVWPIVALLPIVVPRRSLDPHIDPVTSFALVNSAAFLALAVCTILRFRATWDPHWEINRVPPPAEPGRFSGVLPGRLRGHGRPNLIMELILIQVGYGLYTWIRNDAPNRSRKAVASAQSLFGLERRLHIDVEHALNSFALQYDWLEDWLEHYYKTFHFAIPLTLLVWLYWRHPAHYRPARIALCLCTGLALIGFWGFPLAPPRLTPGHGFRDTLHPGADAHPFGAFTKLANQFAAMPSLHIGWSTWCAVVIVTLAPYLWLRVLGVLYPLCTLFAILATANHWILDAVGGAVGLALAWVLQYALTGQRFRRGLSAKPLAETATEIGPSSPSRGVSLRHAGRREDPVAVSAPSRLPVTARPDG
jgi:hypothetical protein